MLPYRVLLALELDAEAAFINQATVMGNLVLVCVHDPAQLTVAAKLQQQQGRIDPTHPLTLLK